MSVFGVIGEAITPSKPPVQSTLATTINVNSNADGNSESLRTELERLNKYVIRKLGTLRQVFADQIKKLEDHQESDISAAVQTKFDDLKSLLDYISTCITEQQQRQQQQHDYISIKFQRFFDEINEEFQNLVQNVSQLLGEVRSYKNKNIP